VRGHKKLAIALTAVALAALGGGAYAATQSNSNPRQAYLNDLAKRLHVSPSQLTAAMKAALLDQIDAAVKAGKITQAEADAMKQRIQRGEVPPLFFGPPGFEEHRFFGPPGFGEHRFFGPPGFGEHRFFGPPGFEEHRFFGPERGFAPGLRRAGPLSAAAKYLGLSDDQLLQSLASGKTLAQVAKARGKSVAGLEAAMVAAVRSRLDQAVNAGRLTKTQEQDLLSRLQAKVAAVVNGTPPMLRFHRRWAPDEGVPPPMPGDGAPMPPPGPAGFGGLPPGAPA
jgi:hypothetical protein